jgi:hypothetical protein
LRIIPEGEAAHLIHLLYHKLRISPDLFFHLFSSSAPDYRRHLTPGITRRPTTPEVDDKRRVGGQVHAVVRRT